jgi:hypothetical protein
VTMSPVGVLRFSLCESLDLAQRPLYVARVPIDAVALFAERKFVMCRVYEWGHPAHHYVARHLLKYLVAGGASSESPASRIEWITLQHLANLIAEEVAFDIENVRGGAQPLIASQQRAPPCTRQAQELRTGECRIANHICSKQPQPSREPDKHAVGGEPRGSPRNLGGILHHVRCSIAKQPLLPANEPFNEGYE